ncbi:predicted protein [Histoplasma capsulatum var. duboisii H88]|uniref:Predicted protein n=1 Tax=Ajellomyces capsulatus (strain H88) TaxID=544711 RepID=F0ULE6_AJEC8|nr:predicted protein [Histoplasma capsulatum var. duboisii H88]
MGEHDGRSTKTGLAKAIETKKTSAVSAGIGELSPNGVKIILSVDLRRSIGKYLAVGEKTMCNDLPVRLEASRQACVYYDITGIIGRLRRTLHRKPPFQRLSSIVYPFFSPTTFPPENLPPSSSYPYHIRQFCQVADQRPNQTTQSWLAIFQRKFNLTGKTITPRSFVIDIVPDRDNYLVKHVDAIPISWFNTLAWTDGIILLAIIVNVIMPQFPHLLPFCGWAGRGPALCCDGMFQPKKSIISTRHDVSLTTLSLVQKVFRIVPVKLNCNRVMLASLLANHLFNEPRWTSGDPRVRALHRVPFEQALSAWRFRLRFLRLDKRRANEEKSALALLAPSSRDYDFMKNAEVKPHSLASLEILLKEKENRVETSMAQSWLLLTTWMRRDTSIQSQQASESTHIDARETT